jgi:glycosyltransferase involved in cell wall biosynthesis
VIALPAPPGALSPGADVALLTTQCFPPRLGGIEAVMEGLARALPTLGWRAIVAADGRAGPGEDWPDGVTVARFAAPKPVRGRLKAWRVAATLRRLTAAGARPVVIADSWKSLERLSPAALAGVPTLALAHGMEFLADPRGPRGARIRAALARADAVAANSRFTAALAAPFAPPGRVAVVNPAIAAEAPPTPDRLAAMRARLGEGPVLATLCRLEPRKGVDMAIRATGRLSPGRPGLTLAVAGAGPDEGRLRALAAAEGVADRVRFLGRVDAGDKAALLASADLFVMPTRREGASVEGFGLVYLEAGRHGAPSVAGTGSGAEDAVEHGVAGLLCDPADADAVAAAVEALLSDPPRRRAMGEAARRRAAAATPEAAARACLAALGRGPGAGVREA